MTFFFCLSIIEQKKSKSSFSTRFWVSTTVVIFVQFFLRLYLLLCPYFSYGNLCCAKKLSLLLCLICSKNFLPLTPSPCHLLLTTSFFDRFNWKKWCFGCHFLARWNGVRGEWGVRINGKNWSGFKMYEKIIRPKKKKKHQRF